MRLNFPSSNHRDSPLRGPSLWWPRNARDVLLLGFFCYTTPMNRQLIFLVLLLGLPANPVYAGGDVLGVTTKLLPSGTLVKAPDGRIFYLKDATKSRVIAPIYDRWTKENHYYKADLAQPISAADLAKYKQVKSVNLVYVGKILKAPSGTQYYIDDKMRKREISATTRQKLKFPTGNLYPTSAAHLAEFSTGPALKGDKQPGGMVLYDGPYHGGRIWKLEEAADGAITKRLFLSDYVYEAWYYPDESQRVAAGTKELARYRRGANIEAYPGGSPFLKRYPARQVVQPANTAKNLTKVRPAVRSLIARINTIALPYYDRELAAAENKAWIDYLYSGEVDNEADLKSSMARHAKTKTLPKLTSRTDMIDRDVLKSKWFPYLFYFVHQQEPEDADRDYWYSRIAAGDRDTIGKLGETLQWLKDTAGATRK